MKLYVDPFSKKKKGKKKAFPKINLTSFRFILQETMGIDIKRWKCSGSTNSNATERL